MLMAHPTVLRNLLQTYEALSALAREQVVAPRTHRQLQEVAYALCVSTGADDIGHALAEARRRLDGEISATARPDLGDREVITSAVAVAPSPAAAVPSPAVGRAGRESVGSG
ncbi:DUF5133 domain-containing protein [Streptomyces zingiberis]|uniref:DUF5133 domain-containing protein n=1 Tax=Streptomyces zingiberis TaxID=2053010 RepID=A0ABX1BV92_9ACTN|nr:DUF5133 domain-containing protein [Streptomyces zingiberis]NJQ00358.1 DUF5133 domain-containing protein [Streptomyces zingiberis]